jgi:hypothetical protein
VQKVLFSFKYPQMAKITADLILKSDMGRTLVSFHPCTGLPCQGSSKQSSTYMIAQLLQNLLRQTSFPKCCLDFEAPPVQLDCFKLGWTRIFCPFLFILYLSGRVLIVTFFMISIITVLIVILFIIH